MIKSEKLRKVQESMSHVFEKASLHLQRQASAMLRILHAVLAKKQRNSQLYKCSQNRVSPAFSTSTSYKLQLGINPFETPDIGHNVGYPVINPPCKGLISRDSLAKPIMTVKQPAIPCRTTCLAPACEQFQPRKLKAR